MKKVKLRLFPSDFFSLSVGEAVAKYGYEETIRLIELKRKKEREVKPKVDFSKL